MGLGLLKLIDIDLLVEEGLGWTFYPFLFLFPFFLCFLSSVLCFFPLFFGQLRVMLDPATNSSEVIYQYAHYRSSLSRFQCLGFSRDRDNGFRTTFVGKVEDVQLSQPNITAMISSEVL